MFHQDSVIIIPARLASSRLPKKVLADINGLSMLSRVVKSALQANICDVVVATESEEVKKEVEKFNITTIITDESLQSGTDRVYAALMQLEKKYQYVINLQSDMPNVQSYVIEKTLELIRKPDIEISTAICKLQKIEDLNKPSVVKLACSYKKDSDSYKALYFSRAGIAYGDCQKFCHLGIYGYKRKSIEKFVTLQQSPLEISEKLEQLRAMENDMSIYCTLVEDFPISVDIQEDLDEARKIIK